MHIYFVYNKNEARSGKSQHGAMLKDASIQRRRAELKNIARANRAVLGDESL
jgi:hypothetical protein